MKIIQQHNKQTKQKTKTQRQIGSTQANPTPNKKKKGNNTNHITIGANYMLKQ